jgi:exonuclease VII large subunit
MESKETEGRTEKLFQNFGKKVDKFLEELDEAGGKLNKEFEGRFEELKQSAEKLKNNAENKERWKEVEDSLKKAGKELENAVKAAFKKKQ